MIDIMLSRFDTDTARNNDSGEGIWKNFNGKMFMIKSIKIPKTAQLYDINYAVGITLQHFCYAFYHYNVRFIHRSLISALKISYAILI